MFIDEVKIRVCAGKWWDWIVSWRREKCIPNGGPRWGDGWHGGDVYIQTTANLNTLSEFRHKKVLSAKTWEKWWTQNMHGANWDDLVIYVPVWSIIKDVKTNEVIVDLSENNVKYLICQWGRWGYWNSHFTSSTRQAPSFAELWDVWEIKDIQIELKLVADIWIIWIPSAWKSTFIWAVTNVKPKVWDYPFTTLIPNLWVLEHKWKTLVLEDVPGLIPGASEWKWLGIEFLKHIERTKVLLHMLDLYRLDNIFSDYEDIRKELWLFNPELLEKEEIIVLSKWDLIDSEMKEFIKSEFEKKFGKKTIFTISAATQEGVENLKNHLIDNYSTFEQDNIEIKFLNPKDIKVIDLKVEVDPKNVDLVYMWDYTFKATWVRLEQIVRMSDFDNPQAVDRVIDVLEKIWVMKKIEAKLRQIWEADTEAFDTDFFFEWNDKVWFTPIVIIWDKTVSLERLKYNL